jgi:membrane-associated protease RseP (regulator of RpoE activity)
LTIHDPGYTSRSRGAGPLGQVLISAAGPAAGFLLAAVLVLGIVLAGHGSTLFFERLWGLLPEVWLPNARLGDLCNDIFFICVMWGLVNLLPIYPLDGGQITREILLKFSPRDGIRQSLLLSILAAGAMAAFGMSRQLWFTAFLFGYLAYASYATLQGYSGRSP